MAAAACAAGLAVIGGASAAPAAAAVAPVTPQSTAGTDFWVTFEVNYDGGSTLFLFAAGSPSVTGTVSAPAVGFSQNYTVGADGVAQIDLPPEAQDSTNDTVGNYGIHVTASAPVSVYGLNTEVYTTDGFLGLPTPLLGTQYLVESYTSQFDNSQFSVIGTVANTTVTITPSQTAGVHPAGTPYTVVLGQGQTYQLGAEGDLTGTSVTADKNVAVFAGSQCTDVPTGSVACNTLTEEMTPVTTWGQSFLTEPLATRSADIFRVLASENGTTVKVNGAVVATLSRGGFYETTLSQASSVTSDKPVHLMQYSQGQSTDDADADPFMITVSPYAQYLNDYTVATVPEGADAAITANYINVVAPTSSVSSITLDGTPVSASAFTPIAGTAFSGAQLAVPFGNHHLHGNLPFGISVYGFGGYDGYGYPGGFTLGRIATVSTVSLAVSGGGTAPVGSTATATATARDGDGNPVPNVRVDFAVSGPNARSGFAYTDASGKAVFQYVGSNPGKDTLVASVGSVSSSPVSFTWTTTTPVTSPVPTRYAFGFQQTPSATVSTTPLSSSAAGTLLVAFVEADGPANGVQSVTSLTGAGLTWTRAAASDVTGSGATEAWYAWAPSKLANVVVTATFATAAHSAITVGSYTHAAHQTGAVGTGNGATGPLASATVTPGVSGSLVVAGGVDVSSAARPVPASGQSLFTAATFRNVASSYWTQTVAKVTTTGVPVTVKAGIPAHDRWSLVAVEIPAG